MFTMSFNSVLRVDKILLLRGIIKYLNSFILIISNSDFLTDSFL